MYRKVCLPVVLLFCSALAQADLPLSLEDISPAQHHMKFGLSLTYYNRNAATFPWEDSYRSIR